MPFSSLGRGILAEIFIFQYIPPSPLYINNDHILNQTGTGLKGIGVFQPFVGLPGLRAFVRAIGPFSVWLAFRSFDSWFVRSFIHIK